MGLLDSILGSSTGLVAGDEAPTFTLKGQQGEKVSSADFSGRKNVIVYFYPKDDTPGCTKAACNFRDHYTAFTDGGAEVLGSG
jgi:peroxiredoxin Q/BCP